MLTVTKLKEVFHKYEFRPLMRFGENYLIDPNIKDKIVSEANISKDDTVLEIGPGFGAITMDLAATGAEVFAIEKDGKACDILKKLTEDIPNLKLIHGDILNFDIHKICSSRKIRVVGNLPYYITTPIVEYLIKNRKYVSSAVIMVQKEVAIRLLASAGNKDYSSLSCFVQYYAKLSYVYTVRRTSFYPEPDVDSSIIKLEMLEKPSVDVKDEALLFKIIRGSFNQRRKSIINSLSREEVLDMPKEALMVLLRSLSIDPFIRPEQLTLADFASITNAL